MIRYQAFFETGDGSETNFLQTGQVVTSARAYNGSTYSLLLGDAVEGSFIESLLLPVVFIRIAFFVHVASVPPSFKDGNMFLLRDGADTNIGYLSCDLYGSDAGALAGQTRMLFWNPTDGHSVGSVVDGVPQDRWNTAEVRFDVTRGIVQWKLNGEIKGSSSSENLGSNPVVKFRPGGVVGGSTWQELYVDNAELSDSIWVPDEYQRFDFNGVRSRSSAMSIAGRR